LDPRGLEDLLERLDTLIYDYIRYLRGLDERRVFDIDIIALPTKNGGLGIPQFLETALETYYICNSACRASLIRLGYNFNRELPDPLEGIQLPDLASSI